MHKRGGFAKSGRPRAQRAATALTQNCSSIQLGLNWLCQDVFRRQQLVTCS